ncbi:hypothetical protein DRO37_09270 [Candidatus Bathyarchaeota archaeon]|nr:MAG: hypothetical protein DRO37_09270 [Candidatus Bathyarchaeota archaeon]
MPAAQPIRIPSCGSKEGSGLAIRRFHSKPILLGIQGYAHVRNGVKEYPEWKFIYIGAPIFR